MVFVRIPSFQQTQVVVDSDGRFSPAALRSLNDAFKTLGEALNTLAQIPEIQAALENLDEATQAAQAAAAAANTAAVGAQTSTDAQKREQALVNSYIEPASVLTASTTTITIASHTRMYADGTTASVTGGTAAATASTDVDYVSYVDADRSGGTVTYVVSTTPPVQTGDTHVVGAVEIPATGTADGGEGPRRPGYVVAKFAVEPDV